jgi:hypothetical protein
MAAREFAGSKRRRDAGYIVRAWGAAVLRPYMSWKRPSGPRVRASGW